MRLAVEALSLKADYALVDGPIDPGLGIETLPLVKGDSLSPSIAAASIVAKETRDALMLDYHQKWPEYGFDRHKGYGTAVHRAASHNTDVAPSIAKALRKISKV